MNALLQQAKELLAEVGEDDTVPKNIRDDINRAVGFLDGEQDHNILKDKVNAVLDELVNDPNMPFYTRTQIWSAVSLLESIEVDG